MQQPNEFSSRRAFFSRSAAYATSLSLAAAAANHHLVLAQDPATPPPATPQTGPQESPFERDYDPPNFKPAWKKQQINRQMAQDFIIFAHSDLEMTRKLLDKEPGLINASIDWGAGDWETALGGASHMGRHDIVEFLLSRSARIDIFCAAMQGLTEAVRAFLTLQPNLIDAKGPHGFNLHFHAQVGGEKAQATLDYLQTVKTIELRPNPFLKKPPSGESK